MPINVRVYSNADDALVAWDPDVWDPAWVGFRVERRNETTQRVTVLNNRIPSTAGGGPVGAEGVSSESSPIRRCIWIDHSVNEADKVSYRVTPVQSAPGGFAPVEAAASGWTDPVTVTGDSGDGLEVYFNRGTLMSQIVTRFVKDDVSSASLRRFVQSLAQPGGAPRRYLSGDARREMLAFLADADQRGSEIYAAIYEINDKELIEGLKAFGPRGHILIGNGGGTRDGVAEELTQAGLDVHHRDLSRRGASSPSVHNKFVVEVDRHGVPTRALTGSTNWTTTGLCTQLNNVLILNRPAIAARYRDQWSRLVAAGDLLPPELKANNGRPTSDGNVDLYFSATPTKEELTPVIDLIRGARQGAYFLMFMPGQSPLLDELLSLAKNGPAYVRGVVSTVAAKGEGIVEVGGQVIRSGQKPSSYKNKIQVPMGVPAKNRPTWAETEFSAPELHAGGLMAIVHSKAIVIDPFSDDCAVITGSHNFSLAASQKNDENLVIIRGQRALAQAYAVHMAGVCDGYAWRAFLNSAGAASGTGGGLYTLDGWKPGGAKRAELEFWMR